MTRAERLHLLASFAINMTIGSCITAVGFAMIGAAGMIGGWLDVERWQYAPITGLLVAVTLVMNGPLLYYHLRDAAEREERDHDNRD